MRMQMSGASLAVLLGFTVGATPAAAQSAESILRTAMERYQQQTANIDNYTLVQNAMGMEVTNYFEKKEVDGFAVFLPSDASNAEDEHGDVLRRLHQFAERMQLEGEETVDRKTCYVLSLDDFTGLDIGMDPQQGSFQPRRGTFYIDADEYLMRRMTMEGDFEMNGQIHATTMMADLQDWRSVEGMPYPFRTAVTMQGIPTSDVSQKDLEEAQQAMQELEKQMEEVPEAQRSLIESMLKPQMERLQQILASGSMVFQIEVKELRVNTGPPQDP